MSTQIYRTNHWHRAACINALLLLLVLLLCACSTKKPTVTTTPAATTPAPPTATIPPAKTATATPTPTRTPAPTVTRQPTRVPSIFKKDGPAAAVDAYRLRPWTEADSQAVLEMAINGEYNYQYVFEPSYTPNFLYEWILKYPQSSAWLDSQWGSAASSPITLTLPGAPVPLTILFYALDYEINTRQTPTQTLPERLKAAGLEVGQMQFAADLFGPGKDGTLLQIEYYDQYLSGPFYTIIALQPGPAGTQIHTLTDWRSSKYQYPSIMIQPDANRNGTAEVIINRQGGWSQWCDSYLDIYEWDGTIFDAKIRAEVFHKHSAFGCDGAWAFEPASGLEQPRLVIHDLYQLNDDCATFEIVRTYQWDGSLTETIPPPDPQNPVCQAAWGDMYLDLYNERQDQGPGIAMLERALSKWDERAETAYGPAGSDYLHLKLGLWYDHGGQPGEALRHLQPLAQKPASSDYDLPSRLAAAYLAGRAQSHLVGACLQSENIWENEVHQVESSSPNNRKAFIKEFGFWVPHWTSQDIMFDPLCDIYDLVKSSPLVGAFSSQAELKAAIEATGAKVDAMHALDLNQDGSRDQVFLLRENTRSSLQSVILMVNTARGFVLADTILYAGAPADPAQSVLNIETFQPTPDTGLAVAIWGGEKFNVVQVNGEKIRKLFGDHDASGFKLHQTDSGATFDLTYMDFNGSTEFEITETAVWDPQQEKFSLPSWFKPYPSKLIYTAEGLIFQQHDFSTAVTFLQSASQTLNPAETYGAAFYRSAFSYLLGLTYEQLAQPDKALAAYYQAWQESPGGMYSVAASAKLELKP